MSKKLNTHPIFLPNFPIGEMNREFPLVKRWHQIALELFFGEGFKFKSYPKDQPTLPVILMNSLISQSALFSALANQGYQIEYRNIEGKVTELDKLKTLEDRKTTGHYYIEHVHQVKSPHCSKEKFLTLNEVLMMGLVYRKDKALFGDGFYLFAGGSFCSNGYTLRVFFCDMNISIIECDFFRGQPTSGVDILLKGRVCE